MPDPGYPNCTSCKFWEDSKATVCNNQTYKNHHGTDVLPSRADLFCCGLYEPKQPAG